MRGQERAEDVNDAEQIAWLSKFSVIERFWVCGGYVWWERLLPGDGEKCFFRWMVVYKAAVHKIEGISKRLKKERCSVHGVRDGGREALPPGNGAAPLNQGDGWASCQKKIMKCWKSEPGHVSHAKESNRKGEKEEKAQKERKKKNHGPAGNCTPRSDSSVKDLTTALTVAPLSAVISRVASAGMGPLWVKN